MDKFYTTPAGYRRLLQRLEKARAAYFQVCASNEEAAGAGDSSVWHDNFAYEENQRQMHQLAQRIRELEMLQSRMQLVPVSQERLELIRIGACVRVRYEEDAREQTVFIGGYEDGEPAADRISYNSPLAKALLGRRPGEQIEAQIGARRRSLEIVELLPPPREELG